MLKQFICNYNTTARIQTVEKCAKANQPLEGISGLGIFNDYVQGANICTLYYYPDQSGICWCIAASQSSIDEQSLKMTACIAALYTLPFMILIICFQTMKRPCSPCQCGYWTEVLLSGSVQYVRRPLSSATTCGSTWRRATWTSPTPASCAWRAVRPRPPSVCIWTIIIESNLLHKCTCRKGPFWGHSIECTLVGFSYWHYYAKFIRKFLMLLLSRITSFVGLPN